MTDWKPIETAPDNQELLFYCSGKYGIGMGLGRLSIFETPDGSLFEPTHWMPLPEPPETVPLETSEA